MSRKNEEIIRRKTNEEMIEEFGKELIVFCIRNRLAVCFYADGTWKIVGGYYAVPLDEIVLDNKSKNDLINIILRYRKLEKMRNEEEVKKEDFLTYSKNE